MDETFGPHDTGHPQFLERVAEDPSMLEHVANVVGGLGQGLASWPFDFTLCLHWIAGTQGLYGARVQATCNRHTHRILTVVRFSLQAAHYLIFKGILFKVLGNETALRLMHRSISSVSGRSSGDAFIEALPPDPCSPVKCFR